jgi:hypothetical protein
VGLAVRVENVGAVHTIESAQQRAISLSVLG